MAIHYREHIAKVTRHYHYRFTCEHCGVLTNWLQGTVYGYGIMQTRSGGDLTDQQSLELHQRAVEDVNGKYERVQRHAQAGMYSDIAEISTEDKEPGSAQRGLGGADAGFPVPCPACGKQQSWQIGNNYLIAALVFPVVSGLLFILSWGVYQAIMRVYNNELDGFSLGELFAAVPNTIVFSGLGTGIVAGIVWFFYAKSKATHGKVRNKPEFSWD
ncbi:MAG: hypothetical protein GX483_02955 [Actinomycetaceae bacterium]|nr:hypothetical protein [Actinomycetaceae bacterium]